MKELLECAPINVQLGSEYDAMIAEFSKISSARNRYAHGRWWTNIKTSQTLLDETEDLATVLRSTRPITAEQLTELDVRMLELHKQIAVGPEEELKRRQRASRQQRPAPRLSKRPRQSARKLHGRA